MPTLIETQISDATLRTVLSNPQPQGATEPPTVAFMESQQNPFALIPDRLYLGLDVLVLWVLVLALLVIVLYFISKK